MPGLQAFSPVGGIKEAIGQCLSLTSIFFSLSSSLTPLPLKINKIFINWFMFFILYNFLEINFFFHLGLSFRWLSIPYESLNAPVSTLKVNFIILRIWFNQHCPTYLISMLHFMLMLMFLDPEGNPLLSFFNLKAFYLNENIFIYYI